MIKVLVVDDQNLTHRIIENYLQSETEIKIIGFADNAQEAIEQIPHLQPDVILMDVETPKIDGLTATKFIAQKFPQTKVLILTVHDHEQDLREALKNGAKGYLLKNITPQELKNAIYYANQGYFQLSLELTEKYLQKIIFAKSELEEISEVKSQLKFLDKSCSKLEEKLEKSQAGSSGEQIERKIAGMLQQEMALIGDRDSNLQFKVDRMKYNQERLEQNVKYLSKVQTGCVVMVLLSVAYTIFSSFN